VVRRNSDEAILFCDNRIAAYYVIESLRGKKNVQPDSDDELPAEVEEENGKSFGFPVAGLNEERVEERDDEWKGAMPSPFVMAESRPKLKKKKSALRSPFSCPAKPLSILLRTCRRRTKRDGGRPAGTENRV